MRDPGGELVSPRFWRRKPLNVLVAETLAHNHALLKRFESGRLWAPPGEVNHNTPKMAFDFLHRTLREQVMALSVFSDFDWEEIND
jgi:hypothetical protein